MQYIRCNDCNLLINAKKNNKCKNHDTTIYYCNKCAYYCGGNKDSCIFNTKWCIKCIEENKITCKGEPAVCKTCCFINHQCSECLSHNCKSKFNVKHNNNCYVSGRKSICKPCFGKTTNYPIDISGIIGNYVTY